MEFLRDPRKEGGGQAEVVEKKKEARVKGEKP